MSTAVANLKQNQLAKKELDYSVMANAVSKAQQCCKEVAKNGYNSYHRYKYAKSEDIIATGKAALVEAGLTLLSLEWTVNGHAKEGADRVELSRKFILVHNESGNVMPMVLNWPICIEKGRPLDKATAIADTISQAYMLRDILLMPIGEPENEDAPKDETKAPEQTTPVNGEVTSMASQEQVKRMDELAVGIPLEAFQNRMREVYGTDEPFKLTGEQAEDLIGKLKAATPAT